MVILRRLQRNSAAIGSQSIWSGGGALAPLAFILAACSGAESAPEITDSTAVASAAEEPTEISGTYRVVMADGTILIQNIYGDGTYLETNEAGAEIEKGTWQQVAGEMCFDPEGDMPEACFAGAAQNEGKKFVARNADGAIISSVERQTD